MKKLLKAAFINPKGAERNSGSSILPDILPELGESIIFIGDDTEFVPHLGLLTIAALLPEYTEAVYIDEEFIQPEEMDKYLSEENFDLVCLSAYNPQAFRAYEIAGIYKKRGITVIMGGLHASSLPEEAAQYVDSVFVGEAEETFPVFVRDFENGDIKKFYKSLNPPDMENSPAPRFDIVRNFHIYNKIPLIATRGCPHSCDFCVFPTVYHSSFRHKKTEQVIREIEMVRKLHPDPFISFSDENMLADRTFAKELAGAMKNLDIAWECYCDIGIAQDDELLDLLEQSGCQLVQIGLETIDPANLENVDPWKFRQVSGYPQAIRKIQKAGVPVMAMFIAGFDGDDAGIFSRLKRFIMENRIREIDFAIMTPMPGTPLFGRLKEEGRILTEDWNKYTWTHVNFQPLRMKAEELQAGPLKLFRDFNDMASKMAKRKAEFTPSLPYHVSHGENNEK
ncbi:MAG: B12-binding domain-containing radical SAM protein [Firmicutes bacterium]|nr:B12-binding domain-containing radical SAM protein [Bacillota bacterium]